MTMFLLGFLACYPVTAAMTHGAYWLERRAWCKRQTPAVLKVTRDMSWPEIVEWNRRYGEILYGTGDGEPKGILDASGIQVVK